MPLPPYADVVVVGAGLAGLAAGVRLHEGGSLDVLVLEADDGPGGRVRTDVVDGLRLDRGFQLLNPAYPEVRRLVDLDALDLRPFEAGVAVAHGDRRYVVGDPLRLPSSIRGDLTAPVAPLREKVALAAWAGSVGYAPARWIRDRDDGRDRSLSDELVARGLTTITDRVLRPFLAGVLAEDDLATSRRLAELLVRSFLRGRPSLPAQGMQALPDQLAARLPADAVRYGVRAREVGVRRVVTDDGTVTARAVVVATDPTTAGALTALPTPPMKALTTYWFHAEAAPTPRALLHVDGDRRGPVVNVAVVSNAAPAYAETGALVAATVLGRDAGLADVVRAQAGVVLGADPGAWELARTDVIAEALPTFSPGTPLRRRNDLGDGLFVAGDHRDTPSIQGALVSGRRAADAVLAALG